MKKKIGIFILSLFVFCIICCIGNFFLKEKCNITDTTIKNNTIDSKIDELLVKEAFIESKNAVLSNVQIIDKKNEEIEKDIEHKSKENKVNIDLLDSGKEESILNSSNGSSIIYPPKNQEEKYKYILNIRMKKVHIEGCNSIQNILKDDLEYSNKELNYLLDNEYSYCSICLAQNEEDFLIKDVIFLVNKVRIENGLSELSWSDYLENTSKIRVNEIIELFSHMRPNNEEWYTVDANIMYGENLAKNYNTSLEVFNAWMESPTHKDNILFKDFRTISISIKKDLNGNYYWAQEFGY